MPHDNRPLLIGLTGNIGSGKSMAAAWFTQHGIPVISTDILGHEALLKPDVRDQLVESFGDEILDEHGAIDRQKLGRYVFGNRDRLKILSGIVHPEIRRELSSRIDRMQDETVIIEIPLLFESKLEPCVDYILLIYADEQTRLQRLKKRDNLHEEDILRRIRSQTNIDKKITLSDLAIENSSSSEDFFEKLEGFLERIGEIERKDIVRFDECTIKTKEGQ